MRIIASVVFATVFVPMSLYRRLTKSSRFGSDFHRSPTAWDLPVATKHRQ